MANEGQFSIGLSITKRVNGVTVIQHRVNEGFRFDVAGQKGPAVGSITVAVAGTDVSFTQLTNLGGVCWFKNQDDVNFVSWGMWDGVEFLPLGEILAGEMYPIRLSRNLGQEYGVGTGTTGAGDKTLRFKADTAPVDVLIQAFDQ